MKRTVLILLAAVFGLIAGVSATSWRAFPTDDMIARATCAECHDVHGAIEWEDAPFQSQVWVLGDVPKATYFIVNDLFPYRQDEIGTAISLPDLLARYGVEDFARVALESLDGGIVTLDREYVTEHARLVPYLEGLRFQDENQHVSTWLKGVRWIVVVGDETPLEINGVATSMGRLLLGDRTTVTAEGGDALFVSELDGKTYRGDYAHLYTGARLERLLGDKTYTTLEVTDASGEVREYPAEQVADAIIATVDGRPSLVLPSASRREWVIDVVRIATR
ncbi:MAG TPA: hypothetical protein GX714_11825 [Chloroflexi bacterium]|jgi:hypothetical protein|nr:hypothetical protein [Chloroflexota bacterium]